MSSIPIGGWSGHHNVYVGTNNPKPKDKNIPPDIIMLHEDILYLNCPQLVAALVQLVESQSGESDFSLDL